MRSVCEFSASASAFLKSPYPRPAYSSSIEEISRPAISTVPSCALMKVDAIQKPSPETGTLA